MTDQDPAAGDPRVNDPDPAGSGGLTRRQVLRGALAGGAALGAGGLLAACAGVQPGTGAIKGSPPTGGDKLRHGGSMSVGATGGGSTDTLDGHVPVTDPDIMRNWNLYESLSVRSPDFKTIDYLVAESIEPEHAPDCVVVIIGWESDGDAERISTRYINAEFRGTNVAGSKGNRHIERHPDACGVPPAPRANPDGSDQDEEESHPGRG